MQICLAKGPSVYVTSVSEDKAVEPGAKAGVNYKGRKYTSDSTEIH